MATGQFEVDTDYLRRSNNEIRQQLQTLKELHGALSDKMSEISGMWEGPAKNAFHQQFQANCVKFSELYSQLNEALNSMEHAAQEYDACDEEVRAVIAALRV